MDTQTKVYRVQTLYKGDWINVNAQPFKTEAAATRELERLRKWHKDYQFRIHAV